MTYKSTFIFLDKLNLFFENDKHAKDERHTFFKRLRKEMGGKT